MNEPSYLANIGDRSIRTLADAERYLTDKYLASYARFGYGLYFVQRKGDDGGIGICGFVKRDILEHADIGFAFLERFQRQGYGFEAAQAVLDYGREQLRFRQVLAVTAEANQGSIRLVEKLGLRRLGVVQLPGNPAASLVLSIEFTSPQSGDPERISTA